MSAIVHVGCDSQGCAPAHACNAPVAKARTVEVELRGSMANDAFRDESGSVGTKRDRSRWNGSDRDESESCPFNPVMSNAVGRI
jgi:hypothetical protein